MNTTEVAILGGAVLKKKRNGAVLKRRKNGEVPNRNLRISLNIAAGGTGLLRHSSRIEHRFGRVSVLCELKRIQGLPST